MLIGRVGQEEEMPSRFRRSYLDEVGNDHLRLRNGENGGLLACHDLAMAERKVLAAGALVTGFG